MNTYQISFTLKSRYTFAQRQSSAAAQRYVFDVRDGNGTHLFSFLTQIVSQYLVFYYQIGGTNLYYYVPQGTEDQLFGNGVSLNVAMGWNGSTATLSLNGTVVKSSPYVPAASNWTTASNFDLGAIEYMTFGGYNVSDDLISQFTVSTPQANLPLNVVSAVVPGRTTSKRPHDSLSSASVLAPGAASLSCDSSVQAGSSGLCELRLSSGNPDSMAFSVASNSEHVRVPAVVTTRAGQTTVHFEVLTDPEASQGTVAVEAHSVAGVTQANLNVVHPETPNLIVPGDQTGMPGTPLRFNIIANDQRPYAVYASGMPAGASFDTGTSTFAWTPSEQDLGVHAVVFAATNSLGLTISKTVAVNILSQPRQTALEILTVGETDQALAMHADSSMLAAIPSVRFDGQPAKPGDLLSIAVAGIDCNQQSVAGSFQVRFGSGLASIESMQPAGGTPAVCRVTVEVPSGMTGPRALISVQVAGQDGRVLSSNTASVAVEN